MAAFCCAEVLAWQFLELVHHAAATNRRIRPHALRLECDRAADDIIEELAIMADQQHCPVVLDQPGLEHFEGFGVQIVRRLVQHDHIRRFGEQLGQQHTIALAAR